MDIDVDEVLAALSRADLDLLVGGQPKRVPPWNDWLIWLGQWMRAQAALEGRRIAVVRMPNRRLGAAFAAIGSAFASARLHNNSLDWEGLRSLAPGTKVFWREGSTGRSGSIASPPKTLDDEFLAVVEARKKASAITRLFTKSAALTYGITLGSVTAVADERLACAERVIMAALTDAPQGWIRSPAIECSVITERSSFLSDISGLDVRVGGTVHASFADVLSITDSEGRSHGKTKVASARSAGVLDETGSITILDGAAAALRMSDTIASSVVVLLDQAEYDEEVEQLFQTYLGYAVDTYIHPPASGVLAPPDSIESFLFGLPMQSQLNA